ncbi:Rpn family recombination-promoting nuclease/putative transposase [Escherichia coli]
MVVPLLFYRGMESPYPTGCVGSILTPMPNWQAALCSAFPLIDVTVMPDDEIMQPRRMALLELIQRRVRQRDLMGLVEQMACLLSSGYANDRQIKGCLITYCKPATRYVLTILSTALPNVHRNTRRV